MKIFQSFLVIIFSCCSTTFADYCDKSLCGGAKHIACGNDGKINSKCASFSEFIDLSFMKKEIVDKHNFYRNKVATGQQNGFQPAVRMGTIAWDTELAKLAGLNVKTCKFAHDSCHNTAIFKHSGQNLASFASTRRSFDIKSSVLKGIDEWYSEYKDATANDMKNFKITNKVIGHFTAIVNDKNIKVGCASLKSKEGKWTKLTTACNYATNNFLDFPIYTDGPTASKCIKGKNPIYPGLCHESEPIDPNNV